MRSSALWSRRSNAEGTAVSKFRIDMISEEIRRETDRIIREDMHDPRLGGTYCITRAEVTRDLRYAKLYVSILEDEKAEGVMAALASGAGFIRRELTHRMRLRYTPEIQFVQDRNIAYGVHVASLLRDMSVGSGQEKNESDDV